LPNRGGRRHSLRLALIELTLRIVGLRELPLRLSLAELSCLLWSPSIRILSWRIGIEARSAELLLRSLRVHRRCLLLGKVIALS